MVPVGANKANDVTCCFFQAGICRAGDACEYIHETRPENQTEGSSGQPGSDSLDHEESCSEGDSNEPDDTLSEPREPFDQTETCKLWLNNRCPFRETCRYLHEKQLSTLDSSSDGHDKTRLCRFFARGDCHSGNACTYVHELSKTGDPAPKTNVCPLFGHKGTCQNPDACQFIHDNLEPEEKRGHCLLQDDSLPLFR